MAIFSQMTAQRPPGTEPEGEGHDDDDITPGEHLFSHLLITSSLPRSLSSTDKLTEATAQATKELEEVLEQLSGSIDEIALSQPAAATPPTMLSEEPPHFTLATSPTKHVNLDRGPHRDPPVV